MSSNVDKAKRFDSFKQVFRSYVSFTLIKRSKRVWKGVLIPHSRPFFTRILRDFRIPNFCHFYPESASRGSCQDFGSSRCPSSGKIQYLVSEFGVLSNLIFRVKSRIPRIPSQTLLISDNKQRDNDNGTCWDIQPSVQFVVSVVELVCLLVCIGVTKMIGL